MIFSFQIQNQLAKELIDRYLQDDGKLESVLERWQLSPPLPQAKLAGGFVAEGRSCAFSAHASQITDLPDLVWNSNCGIGLVH